MYLKNIEVYGFKSFANRINFQFHNGITGIVGPNGSGKSNVADAVRWVLGEQRVKQLRGSNMQDVIFSGTETRKPLSYAYVAITLDNSDHALAIDYDEVTVARRIYRSGESEYLINGTTCRLRDVNELFYDTGIGKEGYSIIGQGQIDKILSGKPEERRELFDEASGIVKFKKRKAVAIAKLENEKQNLLRVSDILSELEKQVGPLERQAEKAKIYLKKKESLKTLDINVFLLENNRMKVQLSELESKLKIAAGHLNDTRAKYDNAKIEYEQLQTEVEELDHSIDENREKLSQTGILRGKLEGEINVLKEQIYSATDSQKHLQHRRATLSAEIEEKNRQKQELLDDKQQTDTQVNQDTETAKELRCQLEEIQKQISAINGAIEAAKNAIIGELNTRATIKSRLGSFDTMMEQITIRKSQLQSKMLQVQSDAQSREEALQQLEERFAEITKEIGSMDHDIAAKEQELGDIRENLMNKDGALRELQGKYQQEMSRLEALSNLTERYEGYGNSVKRVMEQKDKEAGIVGVVADIIKVDKRYETAIETALGGNIQNIVTEDEETAKKMISFLKVNRLGRATFLPLTSICDPQEFKNPESLQEKGVIGMADQLVQVESQYSNVAKAMLGRILVVDHVDHAVKIARKYQYGIRMVTLEGELLVPGGAISGGAFKNNSNLLGRRRELDEYEKKAKEILEKIKLLTEEIEETKHARNRLRMEVEGLKGDVQRKQLEQNTARLSIAAARERMEEESVSAQGLLKEEAELNAQVSNLKRDQDTAQRELEKSESEETNAQQAILQYQGELERLRLEESESLAKVSEWEIQVEKSIQSQGFKQEGIDRISGELERLSGELTEVLEHLNEAQERIEYKNKQIVEIQETIEASHSQQSETEVLLGNQIARKEELTGKQKGFFQIREALSEEMNALDKEVYKLQGAKEKAEESIEAYINYMWDEYEITLSDAAKLRNEEMTNLSEMKRDIGTLKDEIKKLGDVNVNAIEDYKTLMERYTSMKQQHEDIIEAEKLLEGIIEELDTSMRKQFTEKFQEISREFDKVFKELFGGGKATLELMEDEDILEAGIRIIAQPPGKKLQNMMQLSGGEKALSAISLLFAIQNLKPSPFCLLDEIEAALDDSNVGRFAKYLHKLTKSTQFIVITHRRGTMEQVDRLYGITMQEKGVSTLVSVNLIDKLELEG